MRVPICTHTNDETLMAPDAFCAIAGPRTGHPWTTVVPSCNFNRSEANYHRQQETALQYLHGLRRVRPNVDMLVPHGALLRVPRASPHGTAH